MKKTLFILAVTALTIAACNNQKDQNNQEIEQTNNQTMELKNVEERTNLGDKLYVTPQPALMIATYDADGTHERLYHTHDAGYRKDGPVWLCESNRSDTLALFCHFGISMAVISCLTDISPFVLWHRTLCFPSSVTEIVTEERKKGECSFRITKLGDITHLESILEPRSDAGLFPECYTGTDSTDPGNSGLDPDRNP